jgi:hypothetical protein
MKFWSGDLESGCVFRPLWACALNSLPLPQARINFLFAHTQHMIFNFSYHESSCAKLTWSGSKNMSVDMSARLEQVMRYIGTPRLIKVKSVCTRDNRFCRKILHSLPSLATLTTINGASIRGRQSTLKHAWIHLGSKMYHAENLTCQKRTNFINEATTTESLWSTRYDTHWACACCTNI